MIYDLVLSMIGFYCFAVFVYIMTVGLVFTTYGTKHPLFYVIGVLIIRELLFLKLFGYGFAGY
jgi:hypothetical protein